MTAPAEEHDGGRHWWDLVPGRERAEYEAMGLAPPDWEKYSAWAASLPPERYARLFEFATPEQRFAPYVRHAQKRC